MSYSILKVAVVSGATVATGGSIVAGASMFSEPSSPQYTIASISTNEDIQDFPVAEEEEEAKEPETPVIIEKPTCTIYKMKTPVGYGSNRKFTELEKRLGSKEEFFKERRKDATLIWNLNELERQINKACEESTSKGVYIWYGPVSGKRDTWIFSDSLSSKDWIAQGIKMPKDLEVKK